MTVPVRNDCYGRLSAVQCGLGTKVLLGDVTPNTWAIASGRLPADATASA
jgi:hypothetical protein